MTNLALYSNPTRALKQVSSMVTGIYTQGADKLITYNSSADVLRKFCATCGSNIEWGCSERMPLWVAISLTLLEDQHVSGVIKNLHSQSSAPWLTAVAEHEDD